MMRRSDAIEDFASYGSYEKGYSRRTMLSHLSWLRRFAAWIEEREKRDVELHTITLPLVRSYVHSIRARPRTVRGAICPLRTFFDYFTGTGALQETPPATAALSVWDAVYGWLLRANLGAMEPRRTRNSAKQRGSQRRSAAVVFSTAKFYQRGR